MAGGEKVQDVPPLPGQSLLIRIATRRQQAGAGPGGPGGRDARRGGAGRGLLRRRARRQGALRARGRAGAARRRGRDRRPLGEGPARGDAGGAGDRRRPGPRGPGRRLDRGRLFARRRARGRPRSAPPACAAAPSSSPPVPTCGWRSCTATSTPACAASPRASWTRSCWPSPACAGSAARPRSSFSLPAETMTPAAGQGALVLQIRAKRRGRPRGRGANRRRDVAARADGGAGSRRPPRRRLHDADRRPRAS